MGIRLKEQLVVHILFLTDNFPPEGNAPATRTFEHAKEWVKQGHKVTIITTAPNFPEGKLFPGYKNSWYSKETLEGIDVRRVKTYISANEGFVKRILDFMSFMVTGFCAGLFVKKPDVIVGTSPQFFTAVSAWALSAVRFKPFVFELRDIWPASITAVGAMQNSFAIKMLEKIEMFLYKRADSIVSVTHAFKAELISRGNDGNKIDVVLNGVDLSKYKPSEKDPELAQQYGLTNKFVAGYLGTHGMAHALETIVEAAEKLQARDDIVFLFAGGGAGAEQVKQLVANKNLNNVIVLGRQDKELMPKIWSLCDVSLVHLKDAPLFKSVIPSKIFESMGMGIPILIGVPEGEATNIVKSTDSGIVIEPQNTQAMVEAIINLKDDQQLFKGYQTKSFNAASQFDRKTLSVELSDVFVKLTKVESSV